MARQLGLWVLALLLVVLLLGGSLFRVGQGSIAVSTRLGQLEPDVFGPGLHWKLPLDRVHRFDERLTTRTYPGESFLISDQRTLSVDFLLRYRLTDVGLFYQRTGGDEDVAVQRLADLTRDRLKATVAHETLAMLQSQPRGGLSAEDYASLQAAARGLGVELVDLQLQHIDLSDQAASAVYQHMEQAFSSRAQQFNVKGTLQADQIRSDGERKSAELLADATRQAQQIRADADARTAALYARSYGKNPELADFTQSLTAYKSSLEHAGDVLVITPEGDFFKYLRSPSAQASAAPGPARH
ncbi:MAG TPA: SPFH domain-containing protein [Steroidobacteraceae bacterium]|jgi:membrane protease subunit HflC|nr:SPFH domain-containing protein [Steroidobacteraceae bacterium]